MTIPFKSKLKRILSYSPFTYKLVAAVWHAWKEFPYRFTVLCVLLIPRSIRYQVARILRFQYLAISKALHNISEDRLARTVLFVVQNPHFRELKMAEAARLAGWHPILVYTHDPLYKPSEYFQIHTRVHSLFQLVLITWFFRGPLIHVFAERGNLGYIFCAAKIHPVILDIYDTCAQFLLFPEKLKLEEQKAIQLADGMTHRDLRIKYLHKLHNYQLPKHNIFVTDILPEANICKVQQRRNGDIRVVSIGSIGGVGSPDLLILRSVEALCRAGIHVHIYGNYLDPDMEAYIELKQRLEYLHLEQPIYGNAYWEQISRYDFGLSILEPFLFGEVFPRFTTDSLQGCGSSRLMDYIRVGLGIIMSTYPLRHEYFLARRYAPVVVPATKEFLQTPRPALEEALKQKEKVGRKNLSAITTIGTSKRLGDFYTKIAAQV